MWLNVDTNTDFAALFGVSEYPKIAVFSPGKRKKFLLHDGTIDASSISKTMGVIENGDARFTWIKDAIPDFQAWFCVLVLNLFC